MVERRVGSERQTLFFASVVDDARLRPHSGEGFLGAPRRRHARYLSSPAEAPPRRGAPRRPPRASRPAPRPRRGKVTCRSRSCSSRSPEPATVRSVPPRRRSRAFASRVSAASRGGSVRFAFETCLVPNDDTSPVSAASVASRRAGESSAAEASSAASSKLVASVQNARRHLRLLAGHQPRRVGRVGGVRPQRLNETFALHAERRFEGAGPKSRTPWPATRSAGPDARSALSTLLRRACRRVDAEDGDVVPRAPARTRIRPRIRSGLSIPGALSRTLSALSSETSERASSESESDPATNDGLVVSVSVCRDVVRRAAPLTRRRRSSRPRLTPSRASGQITASPRDGDATCAATPTATSNSNSVGGGGGGTRARTPFRLWAAADYRARTSAWSSRRRLCSSPSRTAKLPSRRTPRTTWSLSSRGASACARLRPPRSR